MDAKTSDGKELGWVGDVEFSPKTGRVKAFYVSDGSVAESLVGNVVVPVGMMRGYKDGFMIVDPEVATLALDGGLAARAGEGYARAKQGGREAAARAGKAAGTAVQKGAYGLGRMIGKTKKRTSGMFGSFMDEYKKASK
jgi:sporulation protein YlmC with PRC-barrel domain